jgi:hypothetical protein
VTLDWLGPTLLAWLLLCGPGALLLLGAGVRGRTLWGAAPTITVLAVVLAGALDALLGIPWTPLSALVQLVIVLAAVLGIRRLLPALRRPAARERAAREHADRPRAARPRASVRALDAVPAALAILVGLALAASASRGMGGIDTLNGSYDSFFHIAALEFVRTDRSAFLMTALEGIYGEPTFYPAAFDVITALLPFDTITSANAMALAMLAALPGALGAMVTLLLGPARTALEHRVLPAVAACCAPMFLSIPVIVLVMGLWPFALGALCLPIALGALWRIGTLVLAAPLDERGVLRLRELRLRGLPLRALVLPAALLAGAVLAHPTNVFSLAVAVFAVLLARASVLIALAGARRRGLVLLAVLVLGLAAYGVVAVRVLASMDLTTTGSWPWPSFLVSVLLDRPRLTVLDIQAWALAGLWLLAIVGAVAAVRTRRMLGASALSLLGIVLALSVLTNLESPLARAWVNPWYGARERIAPLFLCALVVLGCMGVRALLLGILAARRPGALPTALVLVGASMIACLAVPSRFPFVGSLAYTAYGVQLAPYVTPRERAFIERTAAQLPADAVVIGNPRDGEALYWSVGGVETVFPTLAEPQTLDSRRVARYIEEAPENPAVCTSLKNVGPTHLYVDTSADSGAAIAPEPSELWEGLTRIPRDHLRLVDRDGPYALYEIEPLC